MDTEALISHRFPLDEWEKAFEAACRPGTKVLVVCIAQRALAGCTRHPTGTWVTQQARNLIWTLQDEQDQRSPMRYLIHDRDAKFTSCFDTVLQSEGIEIVRTPHRAPRANAFAERWVRTLREECLDHLLVISEGHLRRVLAEYIEYYNKRRPHQGIDQRIPVPLGPLSERRAAKPAARSAVDCRDELGGIIHDYCWVDSPAA